MTFVTLIYDGQNWRAVFGSASGRALAERKRDELRAEGYPAVVVPLRAFARAVLPSGVVASLEQLAKEEEEEKK